MTITNQQTTQVYLVADLAGALAGYDRIRWYRSPTGPHGFYTSATSEDPEPAILRAKPLSRALNGLSLRLRVNGTTDVEIPFQLPNPISLEDVVDLLNDGNQLLSAIEEDGELVLHTVATGTAASIEVLASSAAPYLGFLVGDEAIGTSPDSALLAGLNEYRFLDAQSSPANWYYVELRNSLSNAVSPPSAAFRSRPAAAIPLTHLIGCFIRLADLRGYPLGGRRVAIHNVYMPNRVTALGKTWGIFRQYEEIVTDPNGYGEIWLVRGALIDVTVQGAGFTRRLRIPEAGSIVDLLDADLVEEDEFGIHKPNLDFAIRTS